MRYRCACLLHISTVHQRYAKQVQPTRRTGIQHHKAPSFYIGTAEVLYNQFDRSRERNIDGSSSAPHRDAGTWVTQRTTKGEAVHIAIKPDSRIWSARVSLVGEGGGRVDHKTHACLFSIDCIAALQYTVPQWYSYLCSEPQTIQPQR